MARKKNKRDSKQDRYILIADGETEQWYVELLKKYYDLRIKIKPELSPVSIKDQYNMVRKSIEDGFGYVFWIIDFDRIMKENRESQIENGVLQDFKNYYQKAKNEKKWADKLTIIINNPCFEYWFYLHRNPTSTKHFASYDELLPELRKFKIDANLFANYGKSKSCYTGNGGIYERLLPHLQKIDFGKLKSFDFKSCQRQGVSEMYKLFDGLGINKK